MKRIIVKIANLYWRYIATPEKYARHIGVTIGNHCLINTRNWSTEPYLVTIGDNVQITNNVFIHTHGGANCIREQHPDFDTFGKVVIEDWAYIGAFAQIMPGVTIGKGALVAAGSVVTKSVAPHTVVGGNPASFICSTDDYYKKNKRFNVKTKGKKTLEKKSILLSLPDEMFIKK